MTTFAVLATGPSLTVAQVAAVRALPVVVVSDAWRLAPWALALAAQDKAWWRRYPEAKGFAGRKFSCNRIDGVEKVADGPVRSSCNSGLLGVHVARLLGATRVLLLGVDLKGTHFFGPHPPELKTTTRRKFERMKKQFAAYPAGELQIINCTPGSALTCYPVATLEEVL